MDFLLSGQSGETAVKGGSGPTAYLPKFVAPGAHDRGGPSSINSGEWHHYVVTYDGSSLAKGYIDGVLATQAIISGSRSLATSTSRLLDFPAATKFPATPFRAIFAT